MAGWGLPIRVKSSYPTFPILCLKIGRILHPLDFSCLNIPVSGQDIQASNPRKWTSNRMTLKSCLAILSTASAPSRATSTVKPALARSSVKPILVESSSANTNRSEWVTTVSWQDLWLARKPAFNARMAVVNCPRSRDSRAGQFGFLWREESVGAPRSVTLRKLAGGWCERSGLSERVWRQTGPPPERSVERRRFGILEEERDVADAQATRTMSVSPSATPTTLPFAKGQTLRVLTNWEKRLGRSGS